MHEVARLYCAVFDRLPDREGFRYWMSIRQTKPLSALAEYFMASQEYMTRTGVLRDTDYVGFMYYQILDRAPDPRGLQYWVGLLREGLSRAELMLAYLALPEPMERIDKHLRFY